MNRINHTVHAAKIVLFLSGVLLLISACPSHSGANPPIGRRGQVGLFYTESAHTLDAGRLAVTVNGSAAWDKSYIRQALSVSDTNPIVNGANRDTVPFSPSPLMYTISPSIALGITRILDFSVTMPVYFDNLIIRQ